MLSARRLLNLLIAVGLIASIFIAFALNGSRRNQFSFAQDEAEQTEWLDEMEIREGKPWNFILLADESEAESQTADNLENYLRQIQADYVRQDSLDDFTVLNPKRDVLVFCTSPLADICSLPEAEAYIQEGGQMILADGLPEANNDAYLWPMLGIREKGVLEQCSSFTAVPGLLPADIQNLSFEEFNNCTRFSPDPSLQVYLYESEKKTPILYTNSLGKGNIGVINSSILEYSSCTGWFMALFSQMIETNVIPALGIRSLILDNYPLNMILSDDQSMEAWGMNFEAFLVDEFLPAMQRLSTGHDLPFICSTNVAVDADGGFVSSNRNLFETVSYETLRYGSEFVFGAYLTMDGKTMQINDSLLELFQEVLPSYFICTVDSTGPVLFDTDRLGSVQIRQVISKSREWNEEQIPVLSEGTDIEESRLFEMASSLAGYGGFIHRMDCVQLLTKTGVSPDEENTAWDISRRELNALSRDLLSKTEWLDGAVSNKAHLAAGSYRNLSYTWKQTETGLQIRTSSARKGQPFLVRISRPVQEVRGAEAEALTDGYVLIRMLENEAELVLEDE